MHRNRIMLGQYIGAGLLVMLAACATPSSETGVSGPSTVRIDGATRPPATAQSSNGGPDSAVVAMRLQAQIDRLSDEYQKRPRKKFIAAPTEERFARYVEEWRAKIER